MSNSDRRRVVVTGLGVVSAAGIGKDAYWESLRVGRSGIKKITRFDVSSYPCQIAGEIGNFDPLDFMPSQVGRRIDRFAQFGLAAARLAVEDSSIKIENVNRGRIGAVIGTSLGTLSYAEQQFTLYYEKGLKRINPFFATSIIPSTCVTQIMINLGIEGPCYTVSTACASSMSAIGMAFQSIREGKVDVMLAGGSEAPISSYVLATLSSMQLLVTSDSEPTNAYRPFSRDASGFAMGEGAGVVVLEELAHAVKRGANIYAEIVGSSCTSDAHHVMDFSPDLLQASRAIRIALRDANVELEKIEYVNAHGTAVPEHDKSETAIIKKVFGEHAYRIPISTTKPFTGHTFGASGSFGLISCALMLQQGYLHPTLNFGDSSPYCDLDYIPNEGYLKKVDTMLVISFGFGGYNSACVLQRY
jgi:3-oxoacyl-[acyl-carrier-protein] synthase II